jgi:uncharacterized cupin superfamily protein
VRPVPARVDGLDWEDLSDRGNSFRRARISTGTVAEALGCSCYEVPPGSRTWRPHYHTANEEAVYVLSGAGTIRLGPDLEPVPLAAGTYVALPAGPAGTHDIAADGGELLRLFVFSTMNDPEITVLPEDGKARLSAGGTPGTGREDRLISETVDLSPPAVDPDRAPEPAELVVNSEAVAWTDYDHGERTFERRQLGARAGSEALGCSTYSVPPGKRTWLRHWHGANEEALYVLEGSGRIRLGAAGEEYELGVEDYVALPADERGTHEVTAGDGGLEYLVASEMVEPDVTSYPDREMLGVYVDAAPGGDPDERSISAYLDRTAQREYWDE